jgi:uncharacterized protein YjlB
VTVLLDSFTLPDDGRIPNNPALPVLVYRDVAAARSAAACEALFESHGWGGTWRDGIFPFHHFHSVSHEVLGIVSGSATVVLGGPSGRRLEVRRGDVLVLPAGTGHCREGASADLLVIGAYPAGQEDYDLRRGEPDEQDEVRANIARVALPEQDPVEGREGPLVRHWVAA